MKRYSGCPFSTIWTAAAIAGACGGTNPGPDDAPAAQSADRQSIAEYDIANNVWQREANPRRALEHALRAVELDDTNADAAHLVALIYLDFCRRNIDGECRLDRAEQFARLAVGERSEFREAQNTLGVVLIHRRNYPEAIRVLKPLSEDLLYATPENAWGNLGWAYLEKGDFQLAIEALRRSTAVQPAFCVGSYRLGLAYERAQNHRDANDAFTRALEVEDEGCQSLQVAYAGRARARVKLGLDADARTDAAECVRLDKTSPAGRECGAILARTK